MSPALAPCRKCHAEIDTAARRCPSCGYEPSRRGHPGVVLFLGIIFTGSVVGAVIGIPMIWWAVKFQHRRDEFTPTATDPV